MQRLRAYYIEMRRQTLTSLLLLSRVAAKHTLPDGTARQECVPRRSVGERGTNPNDEASILMGVGKPYTDGTIPVGNQPPFLTKEVTWTRT
jgi:hypothetical protein